MVFPKEFFNTIDFEKNQQTTNQRTLTLANNLYPGSISVGPDQDPNSLNSDSVPKDFTKKLILKKNQQTKIQKQKTKKKKKKKKTRKITQHHAGL